MNSKWEISTEVKKVPQLDHPVFIEGLPGIGNVGKIAVDFLIEDLKAVKLYSFFSYKFPHMVFVNEHNLIEIPKLEVYYKKGTAGKQDFLFLTGDIQPIDEESNYTFCEEVLKIVKQFQCRELITTGGIGLQHIPEKPKVFCTGNNSTLLKEYVKKEWQVEKEIFGVVGPIVGVSGILLGLGKKRQVKGVAILAETFGHPMYLGIKGAKEILRVLELKFKLGINFNRMNKEILEVEKELVKKTGEWTADMLGMHAGAQAKKKDVHYIG